MNDFIHSQIDMKPTPHVASIRGGQRKEKIACLDLDNTLLVSRSYKPVGNYHKIKITKMNGQTFSIYVLKRPNFDEFISTITQYFTIVIFTSSEQRYAEPIIESIMPYIPKENRFYRSDCTKIKNNYTKDLKVLDLPLGSVFLIDDMAESFMLQPQNGILVEGWHGSQDDDELIKIIPKVLDLRLTDDVRKEIYRK